MRGIPNYHFNIFYLKTPHKAEFLFSLPPKADPPFISRRRRYNKVAENANRYTLNASAIPEVSTAEAFL